MKFDKNISRLKILSWLFQFSVARGGSDKKPWLPFSEFFFENRTPEIGALVALQSAPFTKWYLSWVVDVKPVLNSEGKKVDTEYHLESIEDGAICRWSNVSVIEHTDWKEHPQWKWTDKQHAFNALWERACYKKRDAYIVLPTGPTFHDGTKVTVGVRIRFSFDPWTSSKTFDDWRRVKQVQLLEFYDQASKEFDVYSKAKKEAEKDLKTNV